MDGEANAISLVTDDRQICNHCGKMRPIREFRYRNRDQGTRHGTCNACSSVYQREYQRGRRAERRKQNVTGLMVDLGEDPEIALGQSSSRADALASAIIAQVGGLRRFAELWQDLVEQSIEQGKLHLVTRALEGVNKLVALTHEQEVRQNVPVEEMTDEELESHHDELLIRDLWKDPEIAVMALQGLGWTVEPPNDSFERPPFASFLEAFQWRRQAAREAAGD